MDIELEVNIGQDMLYIDNFLAQEWHKEDERIFGRRLGNDEWKIPVYIIAYHSFPDDIVGVVKGHFSGGNMYIAHILVKREFRGKNIGSRLMEKAIQVAKNEKCHIMTLKTTVRHQVITFYHKFGFKEVGRIKDGAFHLEWVYLAKYIPNQQN